MIASEHSGNRANLRVLEELLFLPLNSEAAEFHRFYMVQACRNEYKENLDSRPARSSRSERATGRDDGLIVDMP